MSTYIGTNPFIYEIKNTTGLRSEKLIIKVVDCSNYEDKILLRFQNSKGGIDHVIFGKRVVDNFEVSTVNKYQKPLRDITTGDKLQVTEKSARDVFICHREFPKINLDGYKSLLRSEFVQIYINSNWINVDVELLQLALTNTDPFGKISIKVTTATYER